MNRLVGVGIALVALSCSSPAPDQKRATAGRGTVDDTTVVVTHVAVAPTTVNYDGKSVEAGPGYQYVLLDCRIAVAASDVDFDDFQLVRDSAAELGHETNVGNNDDSDYFYWTYLDASSRLVAQPPVEPGPFMARLAFKVPADARQGYLFKAGRYWGPFEFR